MNDGIWLRKMKFATFYNTAPVKLGPNWNKCFSTISLEIIWCA